jgi:hypothetical protein
MGLPLKFIIHQCKGWFFKFIIETFVLILQVWLKTLLAKQILFLEIVVMILHFNNFTWYITFLRSIAVDLRPTLMFLLFNRQVRVLFGETALSR